MGYFKVSKSCKANLYHQDVWISYLISHDNEWFIQVYKPPHKNITVENVSSFNYYCMFKILRRIRFKIFTKTNYLKSDLKLNYVT